MVDRMEARGQAVLPNRLDVSDVEPLHRNERVRQVMPPVLAPPRHTWIIDWLVAIGGMPIPSFTGSSLGLTHDQDQFIPFRVVGESAKTSFAHDALEFATRVLRATVAPGHQFRERAAYVGLPSRREYDVIVA